MTAPRYDQAAADALEAYNTAIPEIGQNEALDRYFTDDAFYLVPCNHP